MGGKYQVRYWLNENNQTYTDEYRQTLREFLWLLFMLRFKGTKTIFFTVRF